VTGRFDFVPEIALHFATAISSRAKHCPFLPKQQAASFETCLPEINISTFKWYGFPNIVGLDF
jgi:hypothetical protein